MAMVAIFLYANVFLFFNIANFAAVAAPLKVHILDGICGSLSATGLDACSVLG